MDNWNGQQSGTWNDLHVLWFEQDQEKASSQKRENNSRMMEYQKLKMKKRKKKQFQTFQDF